MLMSISPFQIQPLSDRVAFGRLITGLQPSDIEVPEVRELLQDLWTNYGLIVFRGTPATAAVQVALSEVFGDLEVHPVPSFRHPENDKLIRITTNPAGQDQDLIELDGNIVGGWIPWHKDIIFTDRLNHGGILAATKVVSTGGETGFIDQIDAFDRLDPAMQQRAEELEIVYHVAPIDRSSLFAHEKVRYLKVGAPLRAMYEREWRPVVHPLVFKQPGTGRKALNYSPLWAQYVIGMSREESHEFLHTLSDFIWNVPAYYHNWKSGDMVLWDNWRMLHRVMPGPVDEIREVVRTTISGDYGHGRIL